MLNVVFFSDFANNVLCNRKLTYGIAQQINQYSFILETKYLNSYSFQHYLFII